MSCMRPRVDWEKMRRLAAEKRRIQAEAEASATEEDRAELLARQRDARARGVLTRGFSQRNHV